MKGATVGIIAYGSTEAAVLEAQQQLSTAHGIKSDFLRIRSLPFTKEVDAFLAKYDQIFVVEMNRDGQMDQILKTEYAQFAPKFKSVAFGDGMPASAKWVREGILAKHESDVKKVNSSQKSVVSKKATPAKKTSAKKVTKLSPKGKKAVTGKTVKKANRK
jgi:pyruvate/2-oxoacid:ferredoxin oxidoreductase alpha subunit